MTVEQLEFQSTLPVWGATCMVFNPYKSMGLFQSTLPVWGATHIFSSEHDGTANFNPRSPCGERPCVSAFAARARIFQSTLPVWGATHCRRQLSSASFHFNPRSPCGERRYQQHLGHHQPAISIHAPRVGSDAALRGYSCQNRAFQSTLPVWGATPGVQVLHREHNDFNPRSPCGERPNALILRIHAGTDFNPRSPCGERRPGQQQHI